MMNIFSNIKGVVLDMDGVLCDSEAFMSEAGVEMFRRIYSVKVQPTDFLPFVGMGEDRYLGGVAEKYGIILDLAKDKISAYSIYLELIKGRLKPIRGAREFVQECRERGIKTAIATSADKMKMDGNLKEIGIVPTMIDACVYGELIAKKKPAPDIFLKAIALLSLRPEECLVMEDAISGITAAKSAGATPIGISSSLDKATLQKAGAVMVYSDLQNVMENWIND